MTNTVKKTACAALVVLLLAECQTDSRDQILATSESQVALRMTCPPFMYQLAVESLGNIAMVAWGGKRLAACQSYQAFAQLAVILLTLIPLAASLLLYHRTGPAL